MPSPRTHPLSRTQFTPAELKGLTTPRSRRAALALRNLHGFSFAQHDWANKTFRQEQDSEANISGTAVTDHEARSASSSSAGSLSRTTISRNTSAAPTRSSSGSSESKEGDDGRNELPLPLPLSLTGLASPHGPSDGHSSALQPGSTDDSPSTCSVPAHQSHSLKSLNSTISRISRGTMGTSGRSEEAENVGSDHANTSWSSTVRSDSGAAAAQTYHPLIRRTRAHWMKLIIEHGVKPWKLQPDTQFRHQRR